MTASGFESVFERFGREAWDDFARRRRGQPVESIRTGLANEWGITNWTDHDLAALSRGEIDIQVRLEG